MKPSTHNPQQAPRATDRPTEQRLPARSGPRIRDDRGGGPDAAARVERDARVQTSDVRNLQPQRQHDVHKVQARCRGQGAGAGWWCFIFLGGGGMGRVQRGLAWGGVGWAGVETEAVPRAQQGALRVLTGRRREFVGGLVLGVEGGGSGGERSRGWCGGRGASLHGMLGRRASR